MANQTELVDKLSGQAVGDIGFRSPAGENVGGMNDPTEVAKGRPEKPVDALVGNDRLRTKGPTDQTARHVQEIADNGVRHIKESAHNIVDKARLLAQRAVHRARRMC